MSSWNRKYRPQTIAGLHLGVVKDEFLSFLKAGNLPQVFIFTGPKGTGKTSTARILGALVNNPKNKKQIKSIYYDKQPSNVPLQDVDITNSELSSIFQGNSYIVQELDAASNRGIDDIRALKERISIAPAVGLMSVYILDEAHMLTTEAFNALLKVLEEPPHHSIFILATTELHKIPETILSRAHVVQFKKASETELTTALENVLKQESIEYDVEAVLQIARQADGSFRDAIKSLEALARTGAVTTERLKNEGFASYEQQLSQLITAILDKNVEMVVLLFNQARESRIQEAFFHAALLKKLHRALEQNLGIAEGTPAVAFEPAKFLLTELSVATLSEASPLPLLPLEMKIIDIITRSKKKPTLTENNPPPKSNSKPPNKEDSTKSDTVMPATVTSSVIKSVAIKKETELHSYDQKADGSILVSKWATFVEKMFVHNATIAALLRSAHPLEGSMGQITVKVFYKFHQEQLKSTKFNQMIRACAEEMLEGIIEFEFLVEEPILVTDLTDVQDMSELSSVAAQALL